MTKSLVRGLSLLDTVALVVGTIIGTGIFLKSATMAQQVGSPALVLLVWALAGLLSLAGALTYAEIGALFPQAGGEYVYLRESYGELPAFLYGWMRFAIASPGSIAAYAVGGATFLQGAVSLDGVGGVSGVGFFFIVFFTGLNCLQVSFGGLVNSILTSLKVCMVLALVIGVVFFSDSFAVANLADPTDASAVTKAGFGLAMLSALWAYDGWNNMPMAAGEVQNPQRNVPLALVSGVLLVVATYLLVNLSFFLALPFADVMSANSDRYPAALPIATKAAQTFLGVAGIAAISVLFVVSSLSAMHGSILTSARVPYAMANDKLFFPQLGVLNGKNVPMTSVLLQGLIASVLAFLGTFNQLTDYVIFASWLFYALVASSVFVFRRKLPQVHRPYKTWGYPLVPVVFILVAVLLLTNTVIEMPRQSLIGLGIILLGVPLYFFLPRLWQQSRQQSSQSGTPLVPISVALPGTGESEQAGLVEPRAADLQADRQS
jgi:APA family basic amino acid/polyamine antiporter